MPRGIQSIPQESQQHSPKQDLLGFLDICHFGVFPKLLLQELVQGLRLVGPRAPEHHVLHAEVQAAHVVHGLPWAAPGGGQAEQTARQSLDFPGAEGGGRPHPRPRPFPRLPGHRQRNWEGFKAKGKAGAELPTAVKG